MTPETKKLARRYLDEVIESGICSGMRVSVPEGGKFLRLLEGEFTSLMGSTHAVAFNSATSGLHAALVALGIGPGSQVLVSSITMSASASCVLHAGAQPYFVDTDPRTGNITLETLAVAFNEANDMGLMPPEALVVNHLFGQTVPIDEIILNFPGLKIVEDAAQAPGCVTGNGRKLAGTVGHIGVYSLNQHKVIQCGEGGVAVTDDPLLAERLKHVRNHGENFPVGILGYNYRMTELQAAVGYAEVSELFARQHDRKFSSVHLSTRLNKLDAYRPMEVLNPPYCYYLWSNALEDHGAPPGWRHRYATPMCCIPYFKENVGQSCQEGAHEFNERIIVRDPPSSLEEADQMADELLEVTCPR